MKVKNILIASVALLGFVSCEKSEGVSSVLPSDNIIRVSAGVTATRAGVETSNLAEFGLFVNHDVDTNYTYSNVKVTKAETVWNTSEMMLWKNATDLVAFTAYAPRKVGFNPNNPNTTITVLTEQITEASLIASDFLFCSGKLSPGNQGTQGMISTIWTKSCM